MASTLPERKAQDAAVPADYDGDGKIDFAVFRPSEGRWYIKRSADGNMTIVDWGLSTDIVVPADYDGDGRVDISVYRPGAGLWWIKQSSTDYTTHLVVVFGGQPGDVPLPGDYTGDGRADAAYFRPNAGLSVQPLGLVYAADADVYAIGVR